MAYVKRKECGTKRRICPMMFYAFYTGHTQYQVFCKFICTHAWNMKIYMQNYFPEYFVYRETCCLVREPVHPEG
jgi:hypothetical protein